MDSRGEHLHPNWRALATVNYPVKRFISSQSSCVEIPASKNAEPLRQEQNGDEVAKFYEEVLQTPITNHRANETLRIKKSSTNKAHSKQLLNRTKFEPQKFFRCAMSNNVEELSNFNYQDDDINVRDDYGWTALMMAACEGASKAVDLLLRMGANADVQDRGHQTAADIAHKKGHNHIEKLIRNSFFIRQQSPQNAELSDSTKQPTKVPFYCDICKQSFAETTFREHQTSTLHQFYSKPTYSTNKLQKFNIPPTNRGLQLMVKQGWDKESGLGPTHGGRLYPVKTVMRKERTGLGIAQPPARVTHFEAYDERATRHTNCNCHKTKPRNRNDIKREKQRDWKRERRLRRELS